MTNPLTPQNLRSQRRLQRVGLALYVMLLTVLLASVFHGLASLGPL